MSMTLSNFFNEIVDSKFDLSAHDKVVVNFYKVHTDLLKDNQNYQKLFNAYKRTRAPVDTIMTKATSNLKGKGCFAGLFKIVGGALISSPFLVPTVVEKELLMSLHRKEYENQFGSADI